MSTTNVMSMETFKACRRDQLVQWLKEEGCWGPSFEALVEYLFSKTDFFTAPASTRWHAAYPGGLFDHCLGVAKKLADLTKRGVCSWQRSPSPYIIGLLHDATKFGAYVMKQDWNPLTREVETWYERNPDHIELSYIHGEDSVRKLKGVIDLTPEEEACIRWHMGAYETESWMAYDAAIKEFENVLWTHTADMYASKVMEEWHEK